MALARLLPLLQLRHLASAMGFKAPREMPDPVSFGYVPATDPALEHLATALSWLLHLPKQERCEVDATYICAYSSLPLSFLTRLFSILLA